MNSGYNALPTDEASATPTFLADHTSTANERVSPPGAVTDAVTSSDPPPGYHELDQCGTMLSESDAAQPLLQQNSTGVDTEALPLPSYETATKLPTYEEVEIEKEEEARWEVIEALFGSSRNEPDDDEPRVDGVLVGNDCVFFAACLLGFFFNWVGLFIGYFFMYSLAGRYGALTGFGTSMVKWLLYLRHSDCCQDLFVKNNVYVYALMNFAAFAIIFRGVFSWMKVRDYAHNPSETQRRRSAFLP